MQSVVAFLSFLPVVAAYPPLFSALSIEEGSIVHSDRASALSLSQDTSKLA
jgi:hypothetical protein